jgi:hypothetical protein
MPVREREIIETHREITAARSASTTKTQLLVKTRLPSATAQKKGLKVAAHFVSFTEKSRGGSFAFPLPPHWN